MRHLTLALVVMLGLAYSPPAVSACTCVMSPGNCAGIAAADAVFEATVESSELRATPTPPSELLAVRVITLRDLKTWRGGPQTTVVTAALGESCGYEFRIGTRYLIVAHRTPDGRLSVSRCGLTQPLSEASGLLEYLQTLDGPSTGTRLWGRVQMPVRWVDFSRDFDPIPAARVTLSGPERRSVITGPDGRYSVADLLHGRYTVSVAAPGTLPQLGTIEPQAIALDKGQAHACAELNFVVPIKSAISGVITDEAGVPLSGVFVSLGLADQLDRTRGAAGGGTATDEKGRYRFDDLPPGRYLVGLNVLGAGPHPGSPFAVAYARTAAGETVVSLPVGGTMTLVPLRARLLTQVVVPGTTRTPEGNPASGIEVTTAMLGERGQVYPVFPIKTDANGYFQLRLWQGERYRIMVGPRFNPDAELEFVASDRPLMITVRVR